MSDHPETPIPCGWVKLWHPSGVLVTLPLPTYSGVGDGGKTALVDYAVTHAAVSAALAAGWLVTAPGLEAGEVVEEVGWVSRSTKEGRSGLADVIAYYSTNEGWTKPILTDYLNTAADRAEFRAATGVSPADIPEYVGEGRLERGKNPKTDALIRKLPRPVKLVVRPNPQWQQAEYDAAKAANKVYKVPKRKFVRWDGQQSAPAAANVAPQQPTTGDRKRETVQWFRDRLGQGPTLAEFNEMMAMFPARGTPENAEVAGLYRDHAEQMGWEFDRDKKLWVFKQTADDGRIPF